MILYRTVCMLERTVLRLLHEQEDEMAGNLALQWTTNDHSYNKLIIACCKFLFMCKGVWQRKYCYRNLEGTQYAI